MKRFEFRLAAVLRHRGALLDQRRREFGLAQADAAAIAEQIKAMRRSRDLHQESIRAASCGGISRTEMVRLRNYVLETREELRKCTWPSTDELKGSTMVVAISILLLGLFTMGIDFVLVHVVRWMSTL